MTGVDRAWMKGDFLSSCVEISIEELRYDHTPRIWIVLQLVTSHRT